MSERQVLIMALRALLLRSSPDGAGFYDHDVEAVLKSAAADLGVDVASEKQRAIDAYAIPASEFDRKWGTS